MVNGVMVTAGRLTSGRVTGSNGGRLNDERANDARGYCVTFVGTGHSSKNLQSKSLAFEIPTRVDRPTRGASSGGGLAKENVPGGS